MVSWQPGVLPGVWRPQSQPYRPPPLEATFELPKAPMKRPHPKTSRPPQSPDDIPANGTASLRAHKKDQKPPWRMRLSLPKVALALTAILPSSLLLLFRTTSHCYNLRPSQRLILTASHLRTSDSELRLRIITHNLNLIYHERTNHHLPPLKSVVIFSHDGDDSTLATIKQWKLQQRHVVDEVKLVPNDAVNVDVSKWMAVLDSTQNSEVMLINDSFVLLRPIPELWQCVGVCGLGWTAPTGDPSRHFQSYLRVLTSCEVDNYKYFYQRHSNSKNVQELIQTLEVNLSWASNTKALYEFAGGHPDEDAVQKQLLSKGYPALKLKKFFETNDPWLKLKRNGEGERISPSLDLEVYRSKNHDLNHLPDAELEKHFAEYGWNENRVYSKLPLVTKDWLRNELIKGPSSNELMSILNDYLAALNRGNDK